MNLNKILLIGATGATGRELLPRLLDAGYVVTALVRRPEAVAVKNERLTVVVGDLRDSAVVDRAVQGQDAVVCAFGPRGLKKDDIQEVLMRNLVAAMTAYGVKRLVNLSAWGADASMRPHGLMQYILQKGLLRNIFADKARGEKLLFASALDYVNACPGRLLNKPARGGVKASVDGKGINATLTRADLADWMVSQLTSETWVRKCPIIGY
jgi:uncharacterized protein YbjT (DUF2867 family)